MDDDEKLDQIAKRLNDLEKKRQPKAEKDDGSDDYNMGNRVLADLIAGLAGGLLFGWLFDSWFGTSPWFLLGFLFLGMFVAFRNIIRMSSKGAGKDKSE